MINNYFYSDECATPGQSQEDVSSPETPESDDDTPLPLEEESRPRHVDIHVLVEGETSQEENDRRALRSFDQQVISLWVQERTPSPRVYHGTTLLGSYAGEYCPPTRVVETLREISPFSFPPLFSPPSFFFLSLLSLSPSTHFGSVPGFFLLAVVFLVSVPLVEVSA